MTGFGAAQGRVGSAQVSVEVRTVNHRFFNPSIKLPAGFTRWEGDVREMLRRRVARGHVSLVARTERDRPGGARLDESRFADYVEQLRELKLKYRLGGDVDLSTVVRLPDLFVTGEEDTPGADGPGELLALVDQATSALGEMRETEGRELAAFLRTRLDAVEEAFRRIAARAPARILEQRERLREAVRELTDGASVDEQRVAQEIALLADRVDVSEEVDRFAAHVRAFRETLDGPGTEPVGKRLGFLLQELVREANTTGSKANDSSMLVEVVRVKEELERMREQVENLE